MVRSLRPNPRRQAALEARGQEQERVNVVTGVYLFDAERRDGHVFATHIKRAHPHPRAHGAHGSRQAG